MCCQCALFFRRSSSRVCRVTQLQTCVRASRARQFGLMLKLRSCTTRIVTTSQFARFLGARLTLRSETPITIRSESQLVVSTTFVPRSRRSFTRLPHMRSPGFFNFQKNIINDYGISVHYYNDRELENVIIFYFPQIIGAINKKYAIEVVYFVLDNAGKVFMCIKFEFFSMTV